MGVPSVGICYGCQLIAWMGDGEVKTAPKSEYGKIEFTWGALDAISTVKADKDDENAPTFDIMGRKVTDTTVPGIYIKNGKKFVVF